MFSRSLFLGGAFLCLFWDALAPGFLEAGLFFLAVGLIDDPYYR
jgi:hypothetical protein